MNLVEREQLPISLYNYYVTDGTSGHNELLNSISFIVELLIDIYDFSLPWNISTSIQRQCYLSGPLSLSNHRDTPPHNIFALSKFLSHTHTHCRQTVLLDSSPSALPI